MITYHLTQHTSIRYLQGGGKIKHKPREKVLGVRETKTELQRNRINFRAGEVCQKYWDEEFKRQWARSLKVSIRSSTHSAREARTSDPLCREKEPRYGFRKLPHGSGTSHITAVCWDPR